MPKLAAKSRKKRKNRTAEVCGRRAPGSVMMMIGPDREGEFIPVVPWSPRRPRVYSRSEPRMQAGGLPLT